MNLVQVLIAINASYGKGNIKYVTIDVQESNVHHPDNIVISGTVTRSFPCGPQDDSKPFKMVKGVLQFLGKKRIL